LVPWTHNVSPLWLWYTFGQNGNGTAALRENGRLFERPVGTIGGNSEQTMRVLGLEEDPIDSRIVSGWMVETTVVRHQQGQNV